MKLKLLLINVMYLKTFLNISSTRTLRPKSNVLLSKNARAFMREKMDQIKAIVAYCYSEDINRLRERKSGAQTKTDNNKRETNKTTETPKCNKKQTTMQHT